MVFQNLWQRLWRDPPPSLACEFTADAVCAARWTPGATQPEQVVTRPLPAGALKPSPSRENLAEPRDVADAVASALAEVTRGSRSRNRDIALLLPDLSARITVLQFDQLPAKPEEVLALLKHRLKKTVPFDVEDAAISFEVRDGEVLAAVAPRAVIGQYESLAEELGYLPGFVTLSTLAGLGLMVPETGPASGSMLLRSGGRLMTIAMIGGGRLRVLRVSEEESAVPSEAPETQEEIFHDIYSSAVFYQDNYGGKVERIFEVGFPPRAAALWDRLESELGVRPRPLVVPGSSGDQARFLGIFGMLAEQARAS